jgi:Ca2+-binding RTX toxin-like protein
MATVNGTNASETINGLDGVTEGSDTIDGKGGNDTIWGLGGNDVIDGGWGHDDIKGGGGADTIDGGSGIDTANYSDSLEGVQVHLSSGSGTGGTASGDTLTSIENITGSYYADLLAGDTGNNVLTGLDGNDTLRGWTGNDTLYGGNGNDTFIRESGADTMDGGAGIDTVTYQNLSAAVNIDLLNDTAKWAAEGDELNSIENLTGSHYDDVFYADNGANVLKGMDGQDWLVGWGGNDTVWGGDDKDWIFGVDDADTLYGEGGDDDLYGGIGNDTLDGGSGADTMRGEAGDDKYYVNSSGDVVIELAGEGNDTVFTLMQNYTLTAANIEIVSLQAGSGTSVTGNGESTTILGNALDNVLEGGGSSDTLSGLGGHDTFVFRPGDTNGDVVFEFEGNGGAAGDTLKFIGYGTQAQGAYLEQASATEWIVHSADGLTNEVFTLYGGPSLDASDVIFV